MTYEEFCGLLFAHRLRPFQGFGLPQNESVNGQICITKFATHWEVREFRSDAWYIIPQDARRMSTCKLYELDQSKPFLDALYELMNVAKLMNSHSSGTNWNGTGDVWECFFVRITG